VAEEEARDRSELEEDDDEEVEDGINQVSWLFRLMGRKSEPRCSSSSFSFESCCSFLFLAGGWQSLDAEQEDAWPIFEMDDKEEILNDRMASIELKASN